MNICIFEFKHFILISILMLLSENGHACGWYCFSNTPIIIDDLIFNICCKFKLNQLQLQFFYLLFNVSYKWSSANTLNIKYHCKSLRNITLTWNVSSPHLNFLSPTQLSPFTQYMSAAILTYLFWKTVKTVVQK